MNISIKLRLFTLACIGILALLIVGIIGAISLGKVGDKVKEIDQNLLPVANTMEAINAQQLRQDVILQKIVRDLQTGRDARNTEVANMISRFEETGNRVDKKINKGLKNVEAILNGKRGLTVSANNRKKIKQLGDQVRDVERAHSEYTQSAKKLIQSMKRGTNLTRGDVTLDSIEKEQNKLATQIQSVTSLAGKLVTEASNNANKVQRGAQYTLFVVIGVVSLALLVFSALLIRSITRPVASARRSAEDLANDELDTSIQKPFFNDEVAGMNRALEGLRDKLQEAARYRQEQEEAEQRRAEQRRQEREDMANQFDSQVGEIIKQVDHAAQELQSMAGTLASAVEETTNQSASVSSAAEQASTNVQTVASSMEEMTASIREITQNVTNTAESAKHCAQTAEASKEKLDGLQEAVGEIDSVIQSINDVAEQTNLLALNATIEAARAGDAGKGFAVVANEVKSLASQTHEMTDEISAKIDHVKNSANETITSVNDIITQIENVDEQTTTVSSAVEEQNTTTEEISRNIQEASQGTSEVAQNIEGIQQAANDSSSATEQLKTSADNLTRQSQNLQQAVDGFLKELRDG